MRKRYVYLERSGTTAEQNDCLVNPQGMINHVRTNNRAICSSFFVRLEFINHVCWRTL